jgi:type IV secretion system protein VirB1
MPALSIAVALQLALANAPQVAPETILAFAHAESRLDPLALYDNTTGRSHAPPSVPEAVDLARSLLSAGHSLDLGLMQINSQNLERTGLSLEAAFDPGASIAAGAAILTAAYRRCQPGRDGPAALRCMASVYNTGREQAGLLNGYVARVWSAAERVVPAIRQAIPYSPPSLPTSCGPPPPSWDGWAAAAHQRCLRQAASAPETPK